jgi:hypothetical protein
MFCLDAIKQYQLLLWFSFFKLIAIPITSARSFTFRLEAVQSDSEELIIPVIITGGLVGASCNSPGFPATILNLEDVFCMAMTFSILRVGTAM